MENIIRRSLILSHLYNPLFLSGSRGGFPVGEGSSTPGWDGGSSQGLYEHVWVCYLAQGYFGSSVKVFGTNVSSYQPALNQTLTSHSKKFQGSLSFKMVLVFFFFFFNSGELKNRRENLIPRVSSTIEKYLPKWCVYIFLFEMTFPSSGCGSDSKKLQWNATVSVLCWQPPSSFEFKLLWAFCFLE